MQVGLQKTLTLKKEGSLNLHTNFLSLNPNYDVRKYNRIKALAKKYEYLVGKVLVDKVHKEERSNFNKFVSGGGRLTYGELRRLNSVWKRDYVDQQLDQDD